MTGEVWEFGEGELQASEASNERANEIASKLRQGTFYSEGDVVHRVLRARRKEMPYNV